jgi:hypothetical protein
VFQDEIIEKIDRLSEILVHICSLDREMVSQMSDWFRKLSDLATETGQREMAAVTEAAALVLERIMVNDSLNDDLAAMPRNSGGFGFYQTAIFRTWDTGAIKQMLIDELADMGLIVTREILDKEHAEFPRV